MNIAVTPAQRDQLRRGHSCFANWRWAGLAKLLLLGLLVTVTTQAAGASALDEPLQSNDEINVPPPENKQKSLPATKPKKPSPATDEKSDKSRPEAKPKKQDTTKPKKEPGDVPPLPPADNAANPVLQPIPPQPPSFGQLDAGQGQLQAMNNVPGFFGDFFVPGAGNVLNVPGTPLHAPQTPGATPLALGFASVSTQGTPTPAQLYFRSVTTTPKFIQPFAPFEAAPGTSNYVYRTNQPGINFTPTPTYQLNTIPPQSANPVGYFVPITSTQVAVPTTPFPGFAGQINVLNSAPPTLVNGHPLNDVIAVGAPITNFGTTPSAVNHVYALFNDTVPPNYNAQPLVFQVNKTNEIPILFVLTSNTSTSVYSPSAAAGGTQKLVDNASPLPRDRVFFNYSYFDNSAIVVDGHAVNINRMTPGFEKTFFNQRMSVEVRVPFATTIDNVNLTGVTNTGNIMLGNQTTYLKALMYSDSSLAISSGLGVQVPTASSTDYTVNGYSITGTGQYTEKASIDVLKIKNQAVHLMPFLGAVYTPNNRFYAQSVAQLDFAPNGNAVYNAAVYPVLNSSDPDANKWTVTSATTGLSRAGTLNDTNFMYLSANAGYWIYKVNNPYERGLTGFAPTMELHYNQSLTRGDTVSGFYGNPGSAVGNISQVNAVIGANAVIGYDKYLSVAYVAPLGTGVNRSFDGELRVMFNYYFGAPRVNPRFSNVPSM